MTCLSQREQLARQLERSQGLQWAAKQSAQQRLLDIPATRLGRAWLARFVALAWDSLSDEQRWAMSFGVDLEDGQLRVRMVGPWPGAVRVVTSAIRRELRRLGLVADPRRETFVHERALTVSGVLVHGYARRVLRLGPWRRR
jgi:ABC-type sulfate transport system permease subunit